MTMLRDLLATWGNWSARNTLGRALDMTTDNDRREQINSALTRTNDVDPLDALRDATELAALLAGWQWQAVHAARLGGSSWDQVGQATGVSAHDARATYVAAVDRQERLGVQDVSRYQDVL